MSRGNRRALRNSMEEIAIMEPSVEKKPKLFNTAIVSRPQEAVNFNTNILESSTEYSVVVKDLAGAILL